MKEGRVEQSKRFRMAGWDITTEQLLDQFREFAPRRLSNQGKELSLDDLYDEWRTQNPTDEKIERDRRAVAASLRAFDRRERGRPANQFVVEFKKKNCDCRRLKELKHQKR